MQRKRYQTYVLMAAFACVSSVTSAQEDAQWVTRSCPREANISDLASFDQMVSKAIMSALRASDYRTAFRYAVDFKTCLTGLGEAVSTIFSGRLEVLDRVICAAPLGVFEVEQRIDPDLGKIAVSMCPKPPISPPKGKEQREQWKDEVLRYLVLQASVGDLPFVRREALAYIDKQAIKQLVEVSKERGEGEAGKQKAESEGGEPALDDDIRQLLSQALILAVVASSALGDFADIVKLFPDEDALCTLDLLKMWILMHASVMAQKQPASALSLAIKRMVTTASLSDMVNTVKEVSEKYGSKCVLVSAAATLALTSFGDEGIDRAVQEGQVNQIAYLLSKADVPMVFGSAASREKVFVAVADESEGHAKVEAICQAGKAAAEDKRYEDALVHFQRALAIEGNALCALAGKILALLALKQNIGSTVTQFLKAKPSADDIQALLGSCSDEEQLTQLAQAIYKANMRIQDDNATRALIGLMDAKPGSKAADAVTGTVERLKATFPKDEKAIANLIAFRHHALMKREKKARLALTRAFLGVREPSEHLKEVSVRLAMYLLHNRHFSALKDFLGVAVRKKVFAIQTLAEIAKDLALLGERSTAKGLVARIEREGLQGKEVILAVAEAYSHLDMGEKALKIFEKIGPEGTWDHRTYFVKGRIEMGLKRYREAHAAFTKAYQLGNEIDAIYFRGLTRLLMGDAEGAEQDFSKCIEMGFKTDAVLGGLAYAYFDGQKYEEAERTFREAIRLQEQSPDNYIGLALSLFRLNRLEEAKEAFDRACAYEKAMKMGYKEAEKKGFVYSDIEKKAWDEMLQAFEMMKK